MQGDITLGEIYSIFPFDNTLCLIKLKGSDVRELLNIVASRNGEAVSKDVHMTIADEKAIEPTINGRPINDDRIYSIATIDYVARGPHDPVPECNRTEKQQHFHERCRYKFHRERKPGGTHHRTSQRGTHNLIE